MSPRMIGDRQPQWHPDFMAVQKFFSAALPLVFCLLISCRGPSGISLTGEEGELPGAAPLPAELAQKLGDAIAERGDEYEPRTRHLNEDGTPKFTNRLILEKSPYLAQHAHNPVNWYPWGDEAFEMAEKLDRPVLLSIGYSTCHWCHVMEHESFEDIEIARYLNGNYVAIKVDREERPDIDAIYMKAIQVMGRNGGWPLTVWLTPNRQPFFAGTYFPPRSPSPTGPPGFLETLAHIQEQFDQNRRGTRQTAAEFTSQIELAMQPPTGEMAPSQIPLHEAASFFEMRFDRENGGIASGQAKFPSSFPCRFLMRHYRRTDRQNNLDMVNHTLEKMAAGGIYDHIGGGFHRYTTDRRWLFPHFEKMLYDNALLAMAYTEAYQLTRREEFARVAREILAYVARDMTSPEGGFYSATDADSLTDDGGHHEGVFFTWTLDEIESAIGKELARVFVAHYNVTEIGNFDGRNILHATRSLEETAAELEMSEDQARTILAESRELLYEARSQRPRPHRDEKILAAWNGLMISAYARAARVLVDDAEHGIDYAEQATIAADFILENMQRDGRLQRSYINGHTHINAYCDDYAFTIAALIDIFEATHNPKWLDQAIRLEQVFSQYHEDTREGGFFRTSSDHESLLAREKPFHDGALPSGNSVAAINLLRLYELTTKADYQQRADQLLSACGQQLANDPSELYEMLLALDFRTDTAKQIVIVSPEIGGADVFLQALSSEFNPNHILVVATEGQHLKELGARVPLVKEKSVLNGKPTAYVCEGRLCKMPTDDPNVFLEQVRKVVMLDPMPGYRPPENGNGN